jgi:hypothetical protein
VLSDSRLFVLVTGMAKKVDLRRAKDAEGQTALHFAAGNGHLDMCKFLVEESGLDVNSQRKTGAHVRLSQVPCIHSRNACFYK